MSDYVSRIGLGAAAAGLLGLAACSQSQTVNAPPPPPPAAAARPAAPVVRAGAPPTRPADGLAGGPTATALPPARALPPATTAKMAPIPNPEDLTANERHRIYGSKYDHAPGRKPRVHAEIGPDGMKTAPSKAKMPTAVAKAAPSPASPAKTAPAKTLPPVKSAPAAAMAPAKPQAVKPVAAKPLAPAMAAKPAAAPAPTAKAAPVDPKMAQLQTALSAPVVAASTLQVASSIKLGQPGAVALTLPQNLFDLIRQQAAKLGIGRAARSSEVSATLTGTGYDITPNGPQTAKLKSGVAPTFQWQVTPRPGVPHSDLRATIEALLRGERKPRSTTLATLEQPGVAAAPAAPAKSGFAWPNIGGIKLPDYGSVDLPGVGKTSSRTLIGGGLVLGALALLLWLARRAAESKAAAERRRKFRTMAAPMDPEPEAAPVVVAEPVHETPAAVAVEPAPAVHPEPEVVHHEPEVVHPEPEVVHHEAEVVHHEADVVHHEPEVVAAVAHEVAGETAETPHHHAEPVAETVEAHHEPAAETVAEAHAPDVIDVEPIAVHETPVAKVEAEAVHAAEGPAAEVKADEVKADEVKANWPWRRDEAEHRELEKV